MMVSQIEIFWELLQIGNVYCGDMEIFSVCPAIDCGTQQRDILTFLEIFGFLQRYIFVNNVEKWLEEG